MSPEAKSTAERSTGKRIVGWTMFAVLLLLAGAFGAAAGIVIVYSSDLPEISRLEEYRPSTITEIYDDEGKVIGTFALQRRVVVGYDDVPKVLRDALISTEDKDFEGHVGINVWRAAGAAYRDFSSGTRAQGGSTLTMQLARNLFLSPERTISRKLQEVLLSIQIERHFTKAQIFTMYANQIFLGHGVYGFEAGAEYYFSKHAKDLTLEEAALLAGLPKSPSGYSPLNFPDRALKRRNVVLNAMLEDGKITATEAMRAKNAPIGLHVQVDPNWLAPYFVEEVRKYLERKYSSEEVHQGGLRVYTSLNSQLQFAATESVLDGLAGYERRHGWSGKLRNVIAENGDVKKFTDADSERPLQPGMYVHALVTSVTAKAAALRIGRYSAELTPADVAWTGQKSPNAILARGDIAYVKVLKVGPDSKLQVSLEQESGVQGSLVAIDNANGDIKAMVGGRDFETSKFNRATQALRQVGSSFKPYIYAAAIEQGATPDDVIDDAPTTFNTAWGPYSPHNYDGHFAGPITLRQALMHSRNVPAVKLASKLQIPTVIEYARKFGITSPLVPVLPLALGSADVTLIEQTTAYTTFPNDGVRVTPRYIRRVEDYNGHVLEENYTEVKDVVSARTARIMTSMLHDVVLHGTAAAAGKIDHPLAGKTGTTNDFTDAWFVGFSPSITCGVWVGFDEKKSLGPKETGAEAALPIWMDFMRTAIESTPDEQFAPMPRPRAMSLAKLATHAAVASH